MVLEQGLYKIFHGTAGPNGREVGRYPVEDLSLLPKPIYVLEESVKTHTPWIVEERDGGNYLKAQGAITGTREDNASLVALLIPEMGKEEAWVVTERPQHGKNVFTVEDSSRARGWVAHEEDGRTKIQIRPLVFTKSLPPQFFPESLFTFIRIDRDD